MPLIVYSQEMRGEELIWFRPNLSGEFKCWSHGSANRSSDDGGVDKLGFPAWSVCIRCERTTSRFPQTGVAFVTPWLSRLWREAIQQTLEILNIFEFCFAVVNFIHKLSR